VVVSCGGEIDDESVQLDKSTQEESQILNTSFCAQATQDEKNIGAFFTHTQHTHTHKQHTQNKHSRVTDGVGALVVIHASGDAENLANRPHRIAYRMLVGAEVYAKVH